MKTVLLGFACPPRVGGREAGHLVLLILVSRCLEHVGLSEAAPCCLFCSLFLCKAALAVFVLVLA